MAPSRCATATAPQPPAAPKARTPGRSVSTTARSRWSSDLAKRVEWDQTELATLVAAIRAEDGDPSEYVDTAYKVPERKYAAWPRHIRTAFERARTVKSGRPSFKLTLREER